MFTTNSLKSKSDDTQELHSGDSNIPVINSKGVENNNSIKPVLSLKSLKSKIGDTTVKSENKEFSLLKHRRQFYK